LYLKRIEAVGFKSFADRIEMEFGPGITAIVGPNGSGKSNVADAIRWVLGEQSARNLRGLKMEDVIFSGSEKRRPISMAEVTLTLDNSDGTLPVDYNEVTITRRVYRDGEGEYLLNRVPCRLKDIHDLLEGTGLGKENFSIIGQGRIDELLNARPEERRLVFEEAAGISRYKNRKREALKKVEEAQSSLLRLSDLIAELEAQVGPLEERARQAELFLEYDARLRGKKKELYRGEWLEIQERLERLRAGVTAARSHIKELEEQLAQDEGHLEENRRAVQSLEEELRQRQEEVNQAAQEGQRWQGELALLAEKLSGLTQEEEKLKAAGQENLAARKQLQEEMAVLNQRVEELALERAGLEVELEKVERGLGEIVSGLAESEAALERQKSELIDLLNEMAGVKNRLTSVSVDLENDRRTRERLLAEEEKIRQAQREKAERRRSLQEAVTHLKELLRGWREEEAKKREAMARLEDELARLADRINLLQVKKEARVSRWKVLEEMERGFEGYQKGPRTVLAAAGRGEPSLAGVLGSVASVIKTDARYERALEAALGGAQQYIITRDEGVARRAIEFLKKVDGGRATFLPLDTVTSRPLAREERERVLRAGAIGLALELVEFEEKYRPALAHLLERVVVTTDLETALAVGRATGFRLRVVTLEGDLLNPGGSLTGGSRETHGLGFLGRRREREALEKEIALLTQSLEETRAELLAAQSQKKSLEEEIASLQLELRSAEMRQVGLEREEEGLAQEEARLEEELKYLRVNREELAEEERRKREQISQDESLLARLKEEEEGLKARLEGHQEGFREEAKRRETLQSRLTELKVEVARQRQEEAGLKTNLQVLRQRLEELRREQERRDQELQFLAQRRQEIEVAEQSSRAELQVWEQRRKAHEVELRSLEERRELLLKEGLRLEREIRSLRRSLEGEKGALQASEVEIARLEVTKDGLAEKLRELGEDPDRSGSGPEGKSPVRSREVLRQEIEELTARIEALGPVSLGSIEEFKELSQRLHFLKNQQLDLEKSREALLRLVDDLDREMKRLFAETFATVRVYFKEIFAELFGGGTAELKLEDPENLLETGIEIIAQPPGKKLQSLSLLSGGEKALASIALLFALLRTRPSAFLVLDEIEAALDEANVERFVSYIQGLASRLQFILITHQKKTMEAAQVLYGISMEEMGVSRLVSLRLVGREKS